MSTKRKLLIFISKILLLSFIQNQTKSLEFNKSDDRTTNSINFLVSIQLRKSNNQYKHQCLGTIIHEDIILTAAHCFHCNNNPKSFIVVIGDDVLNEGPSTIRYKVVKIVQHNNFYPLNGYDIALLKLANQLKLDATNLDRINYNSIKYLPDNYELYFIGRNRIKLNSKHSEPIWNLISHRPIDNKKCRQRKFMHITETDLCAVADDLWGPCDVSGRFGISICIINLFTF